MCKMSINNYTAMKNRIYLCLNYILRFYNINNTQNIEKNVK